MPNQLFYMPHVVKVLWILLLLSGNQLYAQPGDGTVTTEEVPDDDAEQIKENYFDSLIPFSNKLVTVREVPISKWKQLKSDKDFWYADQVPEKEDLSLNNPDRPLLPSWFKKMVWIIFILTMISVLMWYLLSGNIRLFRKPSALVSSYDDTLHTENIFDVDYDKETRKAKANQNYRLAIRLLYLRTLRDLSDNQLIGYKQEKTNTDYLEQLSGTTYYKDFFRLTRQFEYAWYGKFVPSIGVFQQIEDEFFQFKQRLEV